MSHAQELAAGQRFEFGKNWSRFLGSLNDDRIRRAEESLTRMLGPLNGLRFLDLGCGSGLFSLAARRLGATVYSVDYDPHSVACAAELKRRYFPEDELWRIEEGSALDRNYLASLGKFDIVYSWGVLHHTGAMWQALENAAGPVTPGGYLFVSIYNDQGRPSQRWRTVKQLYNRTPSRLRFLVLIPALIHLWWRRWLKDLLRLHPFETWRRDGQERGMSAWYDVVDWVGGYPFEVAKPEEIRDFFESRGFALEKLNTCGTSLGCNEFVLSYRNYSPETLPQAARLSD